MPLYTDSDQVTADLLNQFDSEVSAVAKAANITLEGAGSIARRTWSECADILLDTLTQFSGDVYQWPSAISFSGAFSSCHPSIRLNQIVVGSPYANDTGTLINWMIYKALTLLYEDAAGRLKGDRYQNQQAKYEKAVRRSWRALFSQGIPVQSLPLSAPGAAHDSLAGTWQPNFPDFTQLGYAPGGSSEAPENLAVAMTWVDQSNYVSPAQNGHAESAPSSVFYCNVPAANVLVFDWSGLVPPDPSKYQGGIADGIYQSRKATGVNIYAGFAGGGLTLQNSAPLALTQTRYVFPDTPTQTGAPMPSGQAPDFRQTLQKVLSRV